MSSYDNTPVDSPNAPVGRQVHILQIDTPSPDPFSAILDIWQFITKNVLLLVSCVILGGLSAGVWSVFATKIYRAEVIVAPVSEQDGASLLNSLQSSLGGLAGLAGIQLGGGVGDSTAEAIALLKTRDFVENFIREQRLLPILFYDQWNEVDGEWIVDDSDPSPTIQQGFNFFVNDVLTVIEDRKTGLLTVQVEWEDSEVAADWANSFIARANRVVRERTIAETDVTLEYLREEIDNASFVALKNALYSVVEGQIQRRTLAKTRTDYAFRIVGVALPSDEDAYIYPRPLLSVATGLFIGLLIGFAISMVRSVGQALRESVASDAKDSQVRVAQK